MEMLRSSRKESGGSRPTSSANMVKRQRWRKPAVRTGSWPSFSRDLARSARVLATLRVTLVACLEELIEGDAVGTWVRESFVLATGSGEFGIDVEGTADIADDEEGRASFLKWQGVDVALGLRVGADERLVESGGSALSVPSGAAGGGIEIGK